MQVCTLFQTDNQTTPAPHRSIFTGRMPFLPPNQQRQSTEGRGGWLQSTQMQSEVSDEVKKK